MYFPISSVIKPDILISNLVCVCTVNPSRCCVLLGLLMFSADFARFFTTWETESQSSQGSCDYVFVLKSSELLLHTQLF